MRDVSMSWGQADVVRSQWRPPASMRDAQGELPARQSHLPKIRDDRKSVDRHELNRRPLVDDDERKVELTVFRHYSRA
jgi:hypothetical protein